MVKYYKRSCWLHFFQHLNVCVYFTFDSQFIRLLLFFYDRLYTITCTSSLNHWKYVCFDFFYFKSFVEKSILYTIIQNINLLERATDWQYDPSGGIVLMHPHVSLVMLSQDPSVWHWSHDQRYSSSHLHWKPTLVA